MHSRRAFIVALAMLWAIGQPFAKPLIAYPAEDLDASAVALVAPPPQRTDAATAAQPLSDSFFIFNRRATTPTATYTTPGKIGVPIELGIYLLSAGATGPTGTVTISLGTDSCIATMVPEDQSVFPTFNVRGARGYCTLTPTASGSLALTATYSGDANNTGGAVGKFISSANPTVPIVAAGVKIDPFTSHFVATGRLPDFALAGQPADRWMAFPAAIQGAPPSMAAVTVTTGAQICNAPSLALRTTFAFVTSERGSYAISYPLPLAVCTYTFAGSGYVDSTYAFAGDSTYVASSEVAENELYVLAAAKYPVLVTLSVSSANLPLQRGSAVPITVSVAPRRLNLTVAAPPFPTGTATIRVGTGNCSGPLSAPTPTILPRVICAVTIPMTGDLAINGTYSGDALHASDTASPIAGGSDSAGTTSYAGTLGGVAVTATLTATGSTTTCRFLGAQFLPVSGDPRSPATPPPSGVAVPQGLFDFRTNSCMNDILPGSITVTLTFPSAVPPGTVFYKYGPTGTNPLPHWYLLPSSIAGSTLSFTIQDGGLGDDDLSWNGSILDSGGPAALPSLDLDLDGSSTAATDGLLVLRGLSGFTGTALTADAVGAGARFGAPDGLTARIETMHPLLDVDADGHADALTDGMIVYRYLQGLRGAAMIAGGIGSGAGRSDAAAIATYLDNLSVPPAVVTVVPQNNANQVPVSTTVTLTFGKAMNPATITATPNDVCTGAVQVSADDFITCVPIASVVPSAGATVFTLAPKQVLAGSTSYKVRVTTEAESAGGIPLLNMFDQPVGFTTAN